MSIRDWPDRVQDILDAIHEIAAFIKDMDLASFKADAKTLRAVELDFIVIGEAVSRIPDEIQEAHPEVPWSMMRSMRNRLVHVYFEIDPRLMWDTIQKDLPSLVEPMQTLLKSQKS